MTNRLLYGTTAKTFHWLVVALLRIQFPIGWLMPDVHAGPPGDAMILHVSFGITILALIVLRLIWRGHSIRSRPKARFRAGSGCPRRVSTGCSMHWCWRPP